jgi:phosphate transport system protein
MGVHFEREVQRLKKRVLALGALVEENLHSALVALERGDCEAARRVIATDVTIDELEVEVEEECLKILALHHPVAGDLRYIIAVSKIDNELERIGDLSANICARTIELTGCQRIIVPSTMLAMAERIEAMLSMSLDALVEVDVELARRVLHDDREVDEMFGRLVTDLKEQIREHVDQLDALIIVFSIARYLERLADRMCNICEDIIYLAEGEIVRHQDPSFPDQILQRERRKARELADDDD